MTKRRELGRRIALLRQREGLSARELGRRSELHERTIRRLELGKVDPGLGTLLAIVKGLGLVSVEEVLSAAPLGSRVLAGMRGEAYSHAASA